MRVGRSSTVPSPFGSPAVEIAQMHLARAAFAGDVSLHAARIRAARVPGRECRLRPRRVRSYVLKVARLDAAGLIRPERAEAVAARAQVLAAEMEGARCPTSTEI